MPASAGRLPNRALPLWQDGIAWQREANGQEPCDAVAPCIVVAANRLAAPMQCWICERGAQYLAVRLRYPTW
jgi:hypothetical protein